MVGETIYQDCQQCLRTFIYPPEVMNISGLPIAVYIALYRILGLLIFMNLHENGPVQGSASETFLHFSRS